MSMHVAPFKQGLFAHSSISGNNPREWHEKMFRVIPHLCMLYDLFQLSLLQVLYKQTWKTLLKILKWTLQVNRDQGNLRDFQLIYFSIDFFFFTQLFPFRKEKWLNNTDWYSGGMRLHCLSIIFVNILTCPKKNALQKWPIGRCKEMGLL